MGGSGYYSWHDVRAGYYSGQAVMLGLGTTTGLMLRLGLGTTVAMMSGLGTTRGLMPVLGLQRNLLNRQSGVYCRKYDIQNSWNRWRYAKGTWVHVELIFLQVSSTY